MKLAILFSLIILLMSLMSVRSSSKLEFSESENQEVVLDLIITTTNGTNGTTTHHQEEKKDDDDSVFFLFGFLGLIFPAAPSGLAIAYGIIIIVHWVLWPILHLVTAVIMFLMIMGSSMNNKFSSDGGSILAGIGYFCFCTILGFPSGFVWPIADLLLCCWYCFIVFLCLSSGGDSSSGGSTSHKDSSSSTNYKLLKDIEVPLMEENFLKEEDFSQITSTYPNASKEEKKKMLKMILVDQLSKSPRERNATFIEETAKALNKLENE